MHLELVCVVTDAAKRKFFNFTEAVHQLKASETRLVEGVQIINSSPNVRDPFKFWCAPVSLRNVSTMQMKNMAVPWREHKMVNRLRILRQQQF